MTAKPRLPVRAEKMPPGLVRGLAGHIEKSPLSRGGVIRDCRFDHVAEHVTIVRAIEETGALEHEFRIVLSDGQIRWLAARGAYSRMSVENPYA